MASEVKWIKIVTDIFDDEKIKLIEDMPDADTVIVIWFKLLCLAGKTNNFGILMLADKIPYNDEMLATIFRRPVNTIRMALTVFEQYGMVEIVNGAITIPNWEKHQQLEKLETSREQTKKRVAAYRDRQKKLLSGAENSDCNALHTVTVTQSNADRIEEDIEEDKEILTDSKESVCRTGDVRRITEAWNALGLGQISKLTGSSKRGGMLRARVNEYGADAVLNAIEKIRNSSFLRGQNRRGWTITFDWFVRPNNFPKVLEGQYDDHEGTASGYDRREGVDFTKILGGDED